MSAEVAKYWINPHTANTKAFDEQSFTFRSMEHTFSLIRRNIHRISGKFDCIVGIPRSGLFFANYIALLLNLPLLSLNEVGAVDFGRLKASRSDASMANGSSPRRVLVVDDSVNTGGAIQRAQSRLESLRQDAPMTWTYLAIYGPESSADLVDIILEKIELPRIFEWNLFHHSYACHFLFDLDGVFSLNGPAENGNDGGRYRSAIGTLASRIIPKKPVGAVVTSRLEKNRDVTEAWLRNNGVSYKYLIMLNIDTPEQRRKLALHARYKADVYGQLGGRLFIESEEWQALEIAKITGKRVYCTDTARMIDPARPA